MEIVKVKDYDNEGGMEAEKIEDELKKQGLRAPTPEEWLSLSDEERDSYSAYTPVFLQSKGGLLSRGCDYFGDYGRGVFAGDGPSGRLGVLGVRDTPKQETPTNEDLLDSLIEIVEQHVSPENSCRGCAEMGNPHYVHDKELKECREQMTNAMAEWVKEVFKR